MRGGRAGGHQPGCVLYRFQRRLYPRHRRRISAHRHPENVAQVGGWIGGQEQGFIPLPRQPDGGDARGDRLAHTTLAGKKQRPPMSIGDYFWQQIGCLHIYCCGLNLIGYEKFGLPLALEEHFSHFSQPRQSFYFAWQQIHPPGRQRQFALNLLKVTSLHFGARRE